MRRAYRRPVAEAEVDGPMAFYREGRAEGDFDAGIAMALSAGIGDSDQTILDLHSEAERHLCSIPSTISSTGDIVFSGDSPAGVLMPALSPV